MTSHMPTNDAPAPASVCPGIAIQAMDMLQPPGISMSPAMEWLSATVPAQLKAKSTAEALRKARWEPLGRGVEAVIAWFPFPAAPFEMRIGASKGAAHLSASILVVDSHPLHTALFVAPFRREVDVVVSPEQQVEPALVGRVGPEDLAGLVLVECAQARLLLAAQLLHLEVVEDFAPVQILTAERDAVVEVERCPVRGKPAELPPHPLLEVGKVAERRSRDRRERDVVVLEVQPRRV